VLTKLIRAGLLICLIAAVVGCAPRADDLAPAGQGREQARSGPKRITIPITSEPPSHYNLIPSPIRAAPGALQEFVHPGLTVYDNTGQLRPLLAEAVPALDNRLWTLLPDGRMETTWKLRDGAAWHDGTPLTSADLEFTLTLFQDRELGLFRDKYSDAVEAVESSDARTITVRWKRPFIEANTLFTHTRGLPLPRHLLEKTYTESKAAFTEQSYWSHDFVGTGPFRLKEWARGSNLILAAWDGFVLGRPKLDEIDVRFVTDANTIVANVLSGSADLVLRQALSVDQALHVRDQWRDGKVHTSADGWVTVYPQHLNANPPIVTNVQFRRALLMAIDRKSLADTLMDGLLPVAHSPLFPDTAEYRAAESSMVRYGYEPQRAIQTIEALGYSRGADGQLRDATGQRLGFETRASAQRDMHVKTLLPVVDAWRGIGLDVETQVIPAARASDREEQATFPAFQVLRQPAGRDRLMAYHSAEARVPERNFTGNNNGRYMHPDLDALIDQFSLTMQPTERLRIAAQITRHVTEQLPVLPLFFDATPILIHNRLRGVTVLTGDEDARQAWNSYEWDVTD